MIRRVRLADERDRFDRLDQIIIGFVESRRNDFDVAVLALERLKLLD
jgi:hypothetical protein